MKILGIETSCDETAVAVLDITDKHVTVTCNAISSQIEIHRQYGGVVPEVAAREHARQIIPIIDTALDTAGLGLRDIDLFCATQGPGLMTSLMVGFETGKTVAYANKKPFIATNHIAGHVYSWMLKPLGETVQLDSAFPWIVLIVSGGHTEIILVKDFGVYELLGKTCDDAVGEAFDKTAKMLGLPYPGGPQISKVALQGDRKKFNLPRPMIDSGDYAFSFAGLKTAVRYALEKESISEKVIADMAASFEQAAVDVLVKKTIKSATEYDVSTIAVVGGVAANRYLREAFAVYDSEYTIRFPEMAYTGDNGAMIALAGYIQHTYGSENAGEYATLRAYPNLRLAS